MDERSLDSEKSESNYSLDFQTFSIGLPINVVNYTYNAKILKLLLQKKEKKVLGRKKKDSKEKGLHNKYTSDNLIKKCKSVMIDILGDLINKKIKQFFPYENKRLMAMNQSQISNANVKFNKSFINKNLKDIFSQNLSSKCKRYPIDYNKNLIIELLNQKNKEARIFFTEIFNLTFLDCIEHFRGSKNVDCLESLEKLEEVCQNLNGDTNYKESFKGYIENFENIMIKKRERKLKKEKKLKTKNDND
jgi:hypothetical protein